MGLLEESWRFYEWTKETKGKDNSQIDFHSIFPTVNDSILWIHLFFLYANFGELRKIVFSWIVVLVFWKYKSYKKNYG